MMVFSPKDLGAEVSGRAVVQMDPELLAKGVGDTMRCKALKSELANAISNCNSVLHTFHYAWSLEICLKTLADSDGNIIRLHLHMHVVFPYRRKIGDPSCLQILGMNAHQSTNAIAAGRRKVPNPWMGAYYCRVPKLGQVHSGGSVEPFSDCFVVRPDWITTLVQAYGIKNNIVVGGALGSFEDGCLGGLLVGAKRENR